MEQQSSYESFKDQQLIAYRIGISDPRAGVFVEYSYPGVAPLAISGQFGPASHREAVYPSVYSEPWGMILHNRLQQLKTSKTLSWKDSQSGVQHAPVWNSTCFVNDVERGTGSGGTKQAARDAAAKLAYEAEFGSLPTA
ncbi:hypothetical protein SISSUDRAFT_1062693 [Sistotremastrum suecicum HHB10207 ss-3]|uniref:DRBM domain-containing protein n=1 Tax=Sistotremastrum suecicum HHB10207 ss-3 TaxID=1314776 RepID=A0A166CLJ9_9AGAM|nr:hypothetical protein SISSUDRAFT_1062693 [Sistotremastrum suecicum HHB10207 ss-3]